MKTIVALAVFAAISAPALANGTTGGTPPPAHMPTQGTTNAAGQQQQQQTTTNSSSDAAATNAGNTQQIVFSSPGESTSRVEYSGTQTIKNVPSVNGPPLVSSNDTCMGSISAAVNVPGFGGAFGKTVIDDNCVMLKNSREMWNMGMKGAALARMCMDANNKDALEITGFICPQTQRAQDQAAKNAASPSPEYTDPIVRARMGLPALSK